MSQGDWLILARTKSIIKIYPTLLKKKGLFFEYKQGNSNGKSLYGDIQIGQKLEAEKVQYLTYNVQRI